MNLYARTMRKLSTTSAMRWTLSKVLTPLDIKLKGTRFAPSTLGMESPLCYLTTTGRKSGEQRTVPLLYVQAEDAVAVAATNFGQTNHPAWALNLEDDPNAVLEIDGNTSSVVARSPDGHESADLWSQFEAVWPGYREYRKIAPRDIKMFVLEAGDVPDET
ncbi:MAG: nitroreductase family deazaflavin-dependent oxidoreductase [Acidimicrobiia bacterium]